MKNNEVEKDPRIVNLLAKHGVDLNEEQLFMYDCIEALKNRGIDLENDQLIDDIIREIRNENKSELGSRIVNLLAKNGFDLNAVGEDGHTFLMSVVMSDDTEMVKTLIAQGVDLNKADKDGCTPLQEAMGANSTEVAQMLINAGCDVKAGKGSSPLEIAKYKNNTTIIEMLTNHPDIIVANIDEYSNHINHDEIDISGNLETSSSNSDLN